VYPTPALAQVAYNHLLLAPACSAGLGGVATPFSGPVTPVGAQASQAYSLVDSTATSDLMVLLVDDAVVQVSVTPLTNVAHDPDVLQLVALTAVTRYRNPS